MRLAAVVAEERSFTRAARRCNLSQPALSHRIKELERELGAKLFERHTRHVAITAVGKLFIKEARRTLEQSEKTVSLVRAFAKKEESPITVGISSICDLPKINTMLEQAKRCVADSRVVTRTAQTPELLRQLLCGEIDLAILDGSVREAGVRSVQLASEPLVAALSETLFPVHKQTIHLSELRKLPLALLSPEIDASRPTIEKSLASAGARAFRIQDAGGIHELLDEVALHNRVGLLRQSATRFQRQGVVFKPLDEEINVSIILAWRADNRESKALRLRDEIVRLKTQ